MTSLVTYTKREGISSMEVERTLRIFKARKHRKAGGHTGGRTRREDTASMQDGKTQQGGRTHRLCKAGGNTDPRDLHLALGLRNPWTYNGVRRDGPRVGTCPSLEQFCYDLQLVRFGSQVQRCVPPDVLPLHTHTQKKYTQLTANRGGVFPEGCPPPPRDLQPIQRCPRPHLLQPHPGMSSTPSHPIYHQSSKPFRQVARSSSHLHSISQARVLHPISHKQHPTSSIQSASLPSNQPRSHPVGSSKLGF